MRALVIGGTRFLGKALVDELVKARFDVTVLNRGTQGVAYPEEVQHLIADRSQKAQMEKVLQDRNWDVIYDMICHTPENALEDIEYFEGKTGRLVFISSSFIYPYGVNLHEEQFSARDYQIPEGSFKGLAATESRRVIEAIFAQRAPFKALAVRLPFVFGMGDPTLKLKKLIKQIVLKEPLYFPNREARISVISVEDAGKALMRMGLYQHDGAVNLAAPMPMPISSLIKLIEEANYASTRYASEAKPESLTSFSIKSDWSLDTNRLKIFEIVVKNYGVWLPDLIKVASLEAQKART